MEVKKSMDKTGIADKIYFLLKLSKSRKYTNADLKKVISFIPLHSDDIILGKVFGYSVSDYAFATLYWLNTSETIKLFNEFSKNLRPERKYEIEQLIKKKLYEQC